MDFLGLSFGDNVPDENTIRNFREDLAQKNLSEILFFTEEHRTPAINLYSDLGLKVKDSQIYTIDPKLIQILVHFR